MALAALAAHGDGRPGRPWQWPLWPPMAVAALAAHGGGRPGPSCERPKTALRTVFPLFANNNYFPQHNGIVSDLSKKIRETCMPRGEFKHRYWFFADTPNIASNCRVI
jgi:hypothetical protein